MNELPLLPQVWLTVKSIQYSYIVGNYLAMKKNWTYEMWKDINKHTFS